MFAELSEAFLLVKGVLDVLKGTKDLMPDSPEKQAATVSLDAAGRALSIAEAKAAEELDYHLCRCTWPPQIALLMPDRSHRCPKCNRNVLDDYQSRGGGAY
jgi:hypothetical protein